MENTEMMSNQEVKAEAIKILRSMRVSEELIKDYELNDVVPMFSYGVKYISFQDYVEYTLEKFHVPYKPYAVTIDTVYGYKMFNFLYCSPYREDLDYMCRQGLSDDMFLVYAYCYNLDRPEFSESGSILVQITKDGCIIRIG